MTRRRATDYAGAAGKIAPEQIRKLDPRKWALQLKEDGVYVRIHLDKSGRVLRVYSRSGLALRWAEVESMRGALLGYGGSQLVGELDASTEAGRAAARTRGYPVAHIFDAIRIGERYLANETQQTRRDALGGMVGDVENWCGDDRHWTNDRNNRSHDGRGKFCTQTPNGWRRAPMVRQYHVREFDSLFARVEHGEAEGIVAVRRDAPIGARRAKLKCKPTDTLDAQVISIGRMHRVCSVQWCATQFQVSCMGKAVAGMRVGDWVEVEYERLYRDRTPRFPRIKRIRSELRA